MLRSACPIALLLAFATVSCSKENDGYTPADPYPALTAAFGENIDPGDWADYAGQSIPAYINRDNTDDNPITDAGATLGRVLFYDTNLSANKTVSCASCHRQDHAFGDPALASVGDNGNTLRHTMRLVNARFGFETRFFWDERAETLEFQTTQPIQDHAEMGFSGLDGQPAMTDLLARLQSIDYYQDLFRLAYGDSQVTEERLQRALAQFVRSIVSFDSKYDAGRAQVASHQVPFPNFTAEENLGKQLFTDAAQFDGLGNRTGGGVGCAGCHGGPEFDINPDSKNNGVLGTLNPALSNEINNTRAPSLRDIVRKNGALNGPYMHDGSLTTLEAVIEHYDSGVADSRNLDPRLKPQGHIQQLHMTATEKAALKAFLLTLGGEKVYTDRKWSDPFLRQ